MHSTNSTTDPSKGAPRWPQFTIRDLLLLAIIVAGVMSLWRMRHLQIQRERAVLEKLAAAQPNANWLPEGVFLQYEHVIRLELPNGSAIGVADFAALRRLPKLRQLDIYDVCVSSELVEQIAALTSLEGLSIHNYPNGLLPPDAVYRPEAVLSNRALERLSALGTLRTLRLDGARVTDQQVEYLSRLQNLERLSIPSARLSVNGLRQLGGLKRLEGVLIGTIEEEPLALRELARQLPHCRDRLVVSHESGDTMIVE